MGPIPYNTVGSLACYLAYWVAAVYQDQYSAAIETTKCHGTFLHTKELIQNSRTLREKIAHAHSHMIAHRPFHYPSTIAKSLHRCHNFTKQFP